MSQMREITTIIQNSNSDASEKLTNGSITNGLPQATTKQFPLITESTPKSDRNNNNVMKKSMPPPIPPKKPLKNGTTKTNTDPALDNKTYPVTNNSNGNNNTTSNTAEINHCHGPNALTAAGNVLRKLSNPSKCADKTDGKGQCGVLNSLDNVGVITTDCNGDRKTASGFAGIASSDNHKKLNDDILASTTASKCSSNSGTSHHCDNNGMLQLLHALIRFYFTCLLLALCTGPLSTRRFLFCALFEF